MSATPPVRPAGSSNMPLAPPGQSSVWTEHRNAQGRVYWYHTLEKRSVWEKPAELKTARERAMDSTSWKEYQSGERKYYVHSVTKESSWSLPKELKDVLDAIPDEPSPAPTPMQNLPSADNGVAMAASGPGQQAVRPPFPGFASPSQGGNASPAHVMSPLGPSGDSSQRGTPGPTAGAAIRPPTGPAADRFRSDSASMVGGGEEAFMGLLRDKGVTTAWTWEQTMRQIITEPLYKALATLAERKAAFSKYIRMLEEEKQHAKRQQVAQVTPSVRQTLEEPVKSGRVLPWLSYEGMLMRCKDTSAWKQLEALGVDEARNFWETIRKEMRDHEATVKSRQRQRNIDNLTTLLRSFEADVTTRWKDARQTIFASDEWLTDPHLKDIEVTDMITVFDALIKDLERQKTEELKNKALKQKREERKRRDWFKESLQQGVREGWLHARVPFSAVFLRFRDDATFKEMLGQPGSTPLDLFHDVMDELDIQLQDRVNAAKGALARNPEASIDESTSLEFFKNALDKAFSSGAARSESTGQAAGEQALRDLDGPNMAQLHDEFVRIAKEERRRIERKLRHLSDDLRYALKKEAHRNPGQYDQEAVLDEPWESTWRSRLEILKLREWTAFDQLVAQDKNNSNALIRMDAARIDEVRRAAWERFVKRQKEKLEERGDPSRGDRMQDGDKARSISPSATRKRRGGTGDDGSDGGAATSRPSRRERRAGEAYDADMGSGSAKERERRDRRSGRIDEPTAADASPSAPKRPRRGTVTEDVGNDSEKEEGEV